MRLTPLRRLALAVPAGCLLAAAAPGITYADPTNPVDCRQHPQAAQCRVTATAPSKPGGAERGRGGAGCRYPDGTAAPCRNRNGGSLGADGCFYEPSRYTRNGPHGERPPQPGRGRWFFRSGDARWCGDGGWWVWIPTGKPTPAQLALQAVQGLPLPVFAVRLNPAPSRQLLALPTWMWVNRSVWTARSATASVPGLSVTATARPTKMLVATGDGATVTCRGPGTPWRPGNDPHAASPTCGHTYTRPGTYRVSVTVTWSVSWAGGGASGTVPAVTTTSTRVVEVSESQALNGR